MSGVSCQFPSISGERITRLSVNVSAFSQSRCPCPRALFYPIKHMEKGFTPQESAPSEYPTMIYQVIQNGQAGLISFEDVRAILVAWAKSVQNKSEERAYLFDPTATPPSDPSSMDS